ncbi:MAG: transketolase family protein [Oscillospiraceae bacterium]|nr:transketolase family protein [Oscillospiraceae bacterium]
MIQPQPNRVIYGKTITELGCEDERVVVLDADISKSTNTFQFKRQFPERFFNIGVAEQNMVGIAAGLATTGLIPFASTFAIFLSMRACEQVRTSVAYPNLNVKLVATSAGVEIGMDGVTHQGVEDLSIMRTISNMIVLSPSDPVTTMLATRAIYEYNGPAYMRLNRNKSEVIHSEDTPFRIGKMIRLREGNDATVIATGHMVCQALIAHENLKKEGVHIRVLDCHTIKPIDEEEIRLAATETGGIVTAEDHNQIGGLGAAVCEVTAESHPTFVKRVGLGNYFASSGRDYRKLLAHFHIDHAEIESKVRELLQLGKHKYSSGIEVDKSLGKHKYSSGIEGDKQ